MWCILLLAFCFVFISLINGTANAILMWHKHISLLSLLSRSVHCEGSELQNAGVSDDNVIISFSYWIFRRLVFLFSCLFFKGKQSHNVDTFTRYSNTFVHLQLLFCYDKSMSQTSRFSCLCYIIGLINIYFTHKKNVYMNMTLLSEIEVVYICRQSRIKHSSPHECCMDKVCWQNTSEVIQTGRS